MGERNIKVWNGESIIWGEIILLFFTVKRKHSTGRSWGTFLIVFPVRGRASCRRKGKSSLNPSRQKVNRSLSKPGNNIYRLQRRPSSSLINFFKPFARKPPINSAQRVNEKPKVRARNLWPSECSRNGLLIRPSTTATKQIFPSERKSVSQWGWWNGASDGRGKRSRKDGKGRKSLIIFVFCLDSSQ